MLRKEDFLNFEQLTIYSIERAHLNFPNRDSFKDTSLFEKMIGFSTLYTFRHIIESTESLHLLGPQGEMVEIDTDALLNSDSGLEKIFLDLEDIDGEKIAIASDMIAPIWPFISGIFGTVSTRKSLIGNLINWIEDDQQTRFLRSYLHKFEGYTVLVSKCAVENAWSKIVEINTVQNIENESLVRSEHDDAVPNYAAVLKCFFAAFPDGKNGTWSNVEKRTGYSRRHILRAMKANSGHEDWAEGGQDN